MVFLTAPCTDEGEQPDGAPWPEDNPARLAVYNKLVREVAAEHPTTDTAVNLFGAACPGGKFAGSIHGVAIRETDGVHFTVAGGEYLAPEDHAGDRGGRAGADGRERPSRLTRRVTPAPGSRSGASCWRAATPADPPPLPRRRCSRRHRCSRSGTAG